MYETSNTSIIWGLTPFTLSLGLLYHVISTACPNWLENEQCRLGLWKQNCTSDFDGANGIFLLNTMETIGSWFQITKILQGVAVVCAVICAVSALLRVNHGNLRWQELCAFTAFLTGVLSLSGCAVFAFSKPRPSDLHLSWAFVFNVVSGFLCLLSSPVLYLHLKVRR